MCNLPKLPAPARTMWQYGTQIDHFSPEQMRAYAQEAMAALYAEIAALRVDAARWRYVQNSPEKAQAGDVYLTQWGNREAGFQVRGLAAAQAVDKAMNKTVA